MEDDKGVKETFDEVVFACNANQTLMIRRSADPAGGPAARLGPLRERAAQPHDRALGRLGAPEERGGGPRNPQQPHRAVRSPARQLRNHLHHAQPAAVGEEVRQALPRDLQPDHPHRRGQGRLEVVVPAHRSRCPPRVADRSPVPLHPGAETHLALAARTPSSTPRRPASSPGSRSRDSWERTTLSRTPRRGSGSTSMVA